ncbi:MAG: 50S ribosomal protein L22 [Anaerolineae bacterium CG2_30_64_16]|nr:MAG: 50S ribosomal protein L22 [Anaerolineae bacterium CG2_30_64_16]
MEVRAITKYVGVSPQKTRWVIDQVRGMNAEQALGMLRYMTQSAAQPVAKTIASALANAEENFGLAREDMYVATITADGAPVRRWRRFGARGRFKPIIRRSSHITVVLEERA